MRVVLFFSFDFFSNGRLCECACVCVLYARKSIVTFTLHLHLPCSIHFQCAMKYNIVKPECSYNLMGLSPNGVRNLTQTLLTFETKSLWHTK